MVRPPLFGMDRATDPHYLSRPELIEGLSGSGLSRDTWDQDWHADLLGHAGRERLSPAALASLAAARRCFDQAAQALAELDRAQLALARALGDQHA